MRAARILAILSVAGCGAGAAADPDAGGAADARSDAGVDGPCATAGYATRFDLDEHPLSEGGRWRHVDTTLTVVAAAGGRAFGTQAGGAYDDSNAYVPGCGVDYEVEEVVYRDPAAASSPNREVEILLRWSDTGPLHDTPYGPTRAIGYEINWSHVGAYLILGRFKGPELARAQAPPGPATGDRFRARIQGQRIQVFVNDAPQIDFTDADPDAAITTGDPGIGFFIDAGGENGELAVDTWSVAPL